MKNKGCHDDWQDPELLTTVLILGRRMETCSVSAAREEQS